MHDNDPLAHFRVESLRPQRLAESKHDKVYQLTQSSVSPTRIVGYDKYGVPIEETICVNNPQRWVTHDGCINSAPMSTGHTNWHTMEALHYRQMLTEEMLEAKWFPLASCPYSAALAGIVDNPDRVEACAGKPDGCEHAHAVAEKRKQIAKAMYRQREEEFTKLTPHEAVSLTRRLAGALDVIGEKAREASEAQDDTAPRRPTPRGK